MVSCFRRSRPCLIPPSPSLSPSPTTARTAARPLPQSGRPPHHQTHGTWVSRARCRRVTSARCSQKDPLLINLRGTPDWSASEERLLSSHDKSFQHSEITRRRSECTSPLLSRRSRFVRRGGDHGQSTALPAAPGVSSMPLQGSHTELVSYYCHTHFLHGATVHATPKLPSSSILLFVSPSCLDGSLHAIASSSRRKAHL